MLVIICISIGMIVGYALGLLTAAVINILLEKGLL